jgi:hypothetical protein
MRCKKWTGRGTFGVAARFLERPVSRILCRFSGGGHLSAADIAAGL